MSDNNDKKPNPVIPGWRSPEADVQPEQAQGHAMMDPLAELDRIVNEDLGQIESEQSGQRAISADDLRLLEQDLIRELQGQNPAFGAEPAPAVPAREPVMPATPVSQPTRQSAPAMGVPGQRDAVQPEQPQPYFSKPLPPMPESAPAVPEVPAVEPVAAPSVELTPETASEQVPTSAPALDDWSRLFDDSAARGTAPAAPPGPRVPPVGGVVRDEHVAQSGRYGELSRTEPAMAPPAPIEVEPQAPVTPQEMPVEVGAEVAAIARAAAEVSAVDRDVQSQSEAFAEKIAEPKADPMAGFSAGRGFVVADEEFGHSAPPVDAPPAPASAAPQVQSAVPSEPELSIDELMAELRGQQAAPDVEPVASPPMQAPEVAEPVPPMPVQESYQDTPQHYYQSQAGMETPAEEPVASAAPASFVPGASDGLTPEQVNDPYAALNRAGMQQAAEPAAPLAQQPHYDEAGYQQPVQDSMQQPMQPGYPGSGGAPAVNVSGQADPYATGAAGAGAGMAAGAASSYYSQDQQSQMVEPGHVPAQPGYPAGNGQYGTYSDPNVAMADAESRPYDPSLEYQAVQSEALEEAAPQTKTRKGLVVAIAALAVVGIGGAAIWGMSGSGGSDSETPVIVANNDPVKETPEDPGGKVIPHQNKEVYDRIDGTQSDEGPENLMPATEKPLALTNDGKSPRVISLSGGESTVAQNNGSTDAPAARAPKKVRTVIVRPDGTIVTTNEGQGQTAAAQPVPQSQGLDSTPSEDALSQTLAAGSQNESLAGNDPASQGLTLGSDSVTTSILPQSKPAELVALQAAAREASEAARQAAQAEAPAPLAQVQTPSAAPRPQTSGQQPLVLAPDANNNVVTRQPTQQASVGGAYTVQVTSQRSPEQARAAYANIQSRLASVLGGYQPDIKRADLGDRGIYYRVRVGSFDDQAGASAFCQSIKQAGGDCLVSRR